MRRLSRRGLVTGGASVLAGLGAWWWLVTRDDEDGLLWPLRRVLQFNEKVAEAAFRRDRLSPVFPPSAAREPRPNGDYGLNGAIDPASYTLEVSGPSGVARPFSLRDIRALPRVTMTTELRCIEGWSTVVNWTGARLADLADASGKATRSGAALDLAGRPDDLPKYAGLATPDGQYYVGLDTPSALHPQTLLAYEMNGRALEPAHGAPLRLVIPVKYGIKHLKRIGSIRFSDRRPADFWAERGYDWHSGH